MSGRSAYVLFSLAVRESVKDSLPEGYKVTEIMKKTSSMWREMPDAGQLRPHVAIGVQDVVR